VGIFHNDVAFILQHETDKALNFLDDITLLGPKTHHEKPDGTYETIPENPNIQHFIWEHTVDLNWVLHHLVHVRAMVSAKKLQLCQLEIIVVGRKCTYEGQEPDTGMVEKVLKWPECRNVLEVRGFLGMAGTVRNWIKGFAEVANPLTKLTRVTKEEFRWGEEQKLAIEEMKKPIDHALPFPIILSIDTLVITVSFILAQLMNIEDDTNRSWKTNKNNTNYELDGTKQNNTSADGVDTISDNKLTVEEFKSSISDMSLALQNCLEWIKAFPVNTGKFTPDSNVADELVYLLTVIYDSGWGHTLISDMSVCKGYAPQGSNSFSVLQIMEKLFFSKSSQYNKKTDKGKKCEIVPLSQPHEDKDINMDASSSTAPRKIPRTPPNLQSSRCFLPPLPHLLSFADATCSKAPSPSTQATKQAIDLIELTKAFGDKLSADKIIAMHNAAIGRNTEATNKKNNEMSINHGLTQEHSKLCVTSIVEGHSGPSLGLSLNTNLVPNQAKISIIQTWVAKVLYTEVSQPWVPMSKSYLKIVSISYYTPTDWYEDGSNQLTADDVLYYLKHNPLFENISLASTPHVMKVSLHSDMAVIWIDIWDLQKSTQAKTLINCTLNFDYDVATILACNMHPDISQCQNCWQWGHITAKCQSVKF
ncbi:Pol polyprotein, partial [Leucoagaricus sp. SymC.cos]